MANRKFSEFCPAVRTFERIDLDRIGRAEAVDAPEELSLLDLNMWYARADINLTYNEAVAGYDGLTVGKFRAYINANQGGVIVEGVRGGVNVAAGKVVSDGAGAGYIAGGRFTTYVPATANAKTVYGGLFAPRHDSALPAIAGSLYTGLQAYLYQKTAQQESRGLDIFTESGCANIGFGIDIRNGGAEEYGYGVNLAGANITTADLRLHEGATFNNPNAGSANLALGTIAGTAAKNGFAVSVTDATTFASGFANGIYLNLTNSGAKTGGVDVSQLNAFAADVTLAAPTHFNGGYIYVARAAQADLSDKCISGWNVDLQELGATDYLNALWLQRSATTKGTGVDSFILCSLQGAGVARSAMHFQGIALPDNFLTIAGAARDMVTVSAPTHTTHYYLKCTVNGVACVIDVQSVA